MASQSGEWRTPPQLFRQLDAEFHFQLDVAATDENALCVGYYTKEMDALSPDMPWAPYRCWCNPPYGRGQLPRWTEKAYREHHEGALVVMLLPAQTDTKWFHNLVLNGAEIRFIRRRLTFEPGPTSARFPSLIAIFHPRRGPFQWSRL